MIPSAPIREPLSPLGSHLRKLLPSSPASNPLLSLQQIEIPLELSGSPSQWSAAISDLGFTSLTESAKKLELELAESLDLQGRPHQYVRLTLNPHHLQICYTQSAHLHPVRRKLQALQLALLTLSASGAWRSSSEFQLQIAQAFSDALALVSDDTDSLRLRAESAEKQVAELLARLQPMEAQREADAKRQLADTQTIQSLQEKISHLQHLPDSLLDEELMEWLRAHDGQVHVREAARSIGVAGQRVEDALDRLCKQNRIQRIG